MTPMRQDEGLTLTITSDEAEGYLELGEASDKSLEDVQDAFRQMLEEAVEHPFRSTLPGNLGELLDYLEALPLVDHDLLPDDAKGVIKGWLLHSAVMLTLVSSYYEVMSAEA